MFVPARKEDPFLSTSRCQSGQLLRRNQGSGRLGEGRGGGGEPRVPSSHNSGQNAVSTCEKEEKEEAGRAANEQNGRETTLLQSRHAIFYLKISSGVEMDKP